MAKIKILSDEELNALGNEKPTRVQTLDEDTLNTLGAIPEDATPSPDLLVPRPAPVPKTGNPLLSVSGFEIEDLNRAKENAPAEAEELGNIFGHLKDRLMKDPGGTINALGKEQFRQFVGAPRALFDFLGLIDADKMDDSLNSVEAGRDIGRSIAEVVKDPRKQAVENPIMTSLSVLGLRGMGKALTSPKLLTGVDPVDVLNPSDVKVLPAIEKATKAVGGKISQRAGVGTQAGHRAVEIGAAGGARRKAFKKAKKGVVDEEVARIAGEVSDAIEEAEDLRSMRFEEATKLLRLKDESRPIAPAEVKRSFQDILKERPYNMKLMANEEGGITIDPHDGIFANSIGGLRPEGKRIQEAINILWQWSDSSVEGAHTMQRRLDKLIEQGIDAERYKDSNRILTQVRKKLKEHLDDRVDGYAERAEDYATASRFLKLTRRALGLTDRHTGLDEVGVVSKVNVVPENTLTKVGQLLNDRLNNNLGTKRAIVEELERVVEARRLKTAGVDISSMDGDQIAEEAAKRGLTSTILDELAGVRFSEMAPKGIRGALTGGSASTSVMGGMGTFLATQDPIAAGMVSGLLSILNTFGFENPRAVGSLLLSLGANARRASGVAKGFGEAKDFAMKVGIPSGASFGVVMQQMYKEDRKKYRQTMKMLGAKEPSSPLELFIPSSRASRFER